MGFSIGDPILIKSYGEYFCLETMGLEKLNKGTAGMMTDIPNQFCPYHTIRVSIDLGLGGSHGYHFWIAETELEPDSLFWTAAAKAPVDSVDSLQLIGCNHKWKTYRGLIETYEYCSECNIKRGSK